MTPAFLGSCFPLDVQLLPKVSNLVLQRGDEFGLAAWYADVGRLVCLRRATTQQDEHRTALFRGAQSAALYPAANRSFSDAERRRGLGDG